MADPPFGFHVHSMPGAGEKSGCQEPRDDASVLDGEAERAIPLGISGVAQPHSPGRASPGPSGADCRRVRGEGDDGAHAAALRPLRQGRRIRRPGADPHAVGGIVAVGLTAIVLVSAAIAEAPRQSARPQVSLGGDQLIRGAATAAPG